MATDYLGIQQQVLTVVSGTGRFLNVIDHEPMSPPNERGLVAAIVGLGLAPIQQSGLSSVSMRMEVVIRVMINALVEPQGLIDSEVLGAADAVMGALAADTKLAGIGNVRCVDVFGMAGEGLRCIAGYLDIAQTKFRIADVFIPILINDSWDLG